MHLVTQTLRSVRALLTAGVVMLALAASGYGQTPGSLDPSFNIGAGPTNEVRALARQPDGKFLIAGRFVTFDDRTVNGIARVNADGSYDASFNPGTGISGSAFNVGVYGVAVQSNGKIIVVGSFDSFNGAPHVNIARLNADGSVDASFNASTNVDTGNPNFLRAVAVQGDDKILLGGNILTVNGVPRANVARLNTDGSLDGGFNPGTVAGDANGGFVAAIVVQPNGKIVLAGKMASNNVLRLNQDGSPDAGFDISASPGGTVYAAALQSDGKVVIGGAFQDFGDFFRFGIARVNADGTLDEGYKPNLGTGNFTVFGIAIQADGKAVVGGEGDDDTIPGIGRFNTDGSTDTSYTAKLDGVNSAGVFINAAIPVPGNNGTLVGGAFGMINGATVNSVALLSGGPGGSTGSNHPAFFNGEANLGNGVYYLAFGGTPFGYYSYLSDEHYIFHFDLGYEYVFDAADGKGGVYLYDFTSGSFFYTSPSFPFPYLYDFSLGTVLYYFPDTTSAGHYTTNPRFFLNTSTGQIFSK